MRPIIAAACLFAALSSAGCKTMRTVTLDQLNRLGADRVWATENNHSIVLLDEPKVVGDTLVGYVGRHRAKLPSAELKQLRVQTSARTRTALLALGGTAGFIGFLVVVAGSGQSQVQPRVTAGQPGDCVKHPEQCNGGN